MWRAMVTFGNGQTMTVGSDDPDPAEAEAFAWEAARMAVGMEPASVEVVRQR